MIDPEHDLSPESIAVLQALYGGQERDASEPNDEKILSYLAGVLSDEEQNEVLQHLVDHEEWLDRFLSLRENAHQTPSVLAVVMKRALAMLGESGGVSDRLRLRALGRSIALASRIPNFALQRGSGDSPLMDERVRALGEVRLYASIDSEGFVTLRLYANAEQSEGQQIRAEILDPVGGAVLLGTISVLAGTGTLKSAYALGDGLPEGSIPASMFRLSIVPAPASNQARNHVYAEVSGGPYHREVLPLEIIESPRFAEGVMSVSLLLPGPIRVRFANYRLEILLSIGLIDQPVGSWPIASFDSDVAQLASPTSNISGSHSSLGSIFKVNIVRQR